MEKLQMSEFGHLLSLMKDSAFDDTCNISFLWGKWVSPNNWVHRHTEVLPLFVASRGHVRVPEPGPHLSKTGLKCSLTPSLP